MKWLGDKLKQLVNVAGYTQAQFSERIGVSRQTFSDWCNGQVPKGSHLLKIGQLLNVDADALFAEDPERLARAAVPVHRKKGSAKVTPEVQSLSHRLALDYLGVIAPQTVPILTPQARCQVPDLATVPLLARELRDLAGLADSARPMDYKEAFSLMRRLGICIVFRHFPEEIRSHYAFYTVLNGQRVVFVNTGTHLLDLIFPLIHEAVHAVRDLPPTEGFDQDEEDFCDAVANAVQFPDPYIELAWEAIKGLPPAQQVNKLKGFARQNHHACYGLVRCLQARHPKALLKLNVHGADANLRKTCKTLEEVFLPPDGTVEQYLRQLQELSPLFYQALVKYAGNCTASRLGELLDLGTLDARQVQGVLNGEKSGGISGHVRRL
jgi:transcriptional regulator with XRE-family HTH domain